LRDAVPTRLVASSTVETSHGRCLAMSETFHVVPDEDLLEHEEIQDLCVCGPHVEFFPRGKVVVHHALDGRHGDDPTWPRQRAHQVAREQSLSEDSLL
jgi:hypothetical protein